MQLLDNNILIATLALKPIIKQRGISKHIRKQKVEQCPELMEVVLERRSGDKKTVTGVKYTDDLSQRRLFIFDSVGL